MCGYSGTAISRAWGEWPPFAYLIVGIVLAGVDGQDWLRKVPAVCFLLDPAEKPVAAALLVAELHVRGAPLAVELTAQRRVDAWVGKWGGRMGRRECGVGEIAFSGNENHGGAFPTK